MEFSAKLLLLLSLGAATVTLALEGEVEGQQPVGSPPSLQALTQEEPPSGNPRVHPIILVPGDGGSQIEARLNKTEAAHFWCSKASDWYDLWLNIEQMLTLLVSCWVDNVRLVYDRDTHTTSDAPGVETRIPGFGNTSSVEFIDKSMRSFSTYFAMIVAGLVKQGYIRGENIHGAPYDFRRAANEHGEYFSQVKGLIEETFERNNHTQVVLVCHSMGSIMMHYFLQQQTPAWREKHIRALVSVAGVWGGTARALKVFAIGDNLDSWFLNSKNLLWERTNPSLAWLMPQQGFWSDDEVLVETEKKNFTRTNIGEFFDGYKEHNMAMMVNDTKGLLGGLPPPQVEVFCIHGSQVNTTERVIYPPGSFPPSLAPTAQRQQTSNKSKNLKKWWPFPTEPSLVKGDGDGTVNIRSLKGCLKWKGAQKQAVHHKIFKGINHVDMLRREEPTSYVVNVIDGLNKQLQRTQVDEIRTSAEEGTLEEAALTEVDQVESSEVEVGLLGEEGQEGSGAEGELVGDNEVELDQQSSVEDLNTHHGVFPIIEVSSGKK
jgi:lysophospholipase-3